MTNKYIYATNASKTHKYASFHILGIKDDILVGYTEKPEQGISIAYKGEVLFIPFSYKTTKGE